MKTSLKLLSAFFLIVHATSAQTFVNKTWQQQVANPSTYDYVSTALDVNNNLITTANNLMGSNTHAHLNKLNNSGAMTWSVNCTNGAAQNHYGVDVKTDAAGNIYMCAAYHNGSNYDYTVYKYSPSGAIVWQKFYNGVSNKDDVPTSIALDNVGNVYVTGSSYNGTFPDYLTIKYDNNGVQKWAIPYDNVGLPDVATGLVVDNTGVFVIGSSASSISNSDVTIVKYDNLGNQIGLYRHPFSGNGIDLPSEINLDNSGNILITGSFDNGTKQFGTIKLNSSLAFLWFQSVPGNFLSEGYSVCSDNSGNVISVGYQNNVNGGSDIIVNKYSPAGALIWPQKFHCADPSQFAKGRKVKTDLSGNIYIAGEGKVNATQDFLTLVLNPSGDIKWMRYFDSPTGGSDVPNAIQINNNTVYVSGITTNGSSKTISSVKYSTMEANQPVVSNPSRTQNELLVRFDVSAVIPSAINNKDFVHGKLSDFLKTGALNVLIKDFGPEVSSYQCYKVFPRMTMADSTSLSRSGRTVKVMNHYTTLGVLLPTGSNDSLMRVKFNNHPPIVNIADYNYICYTSASANDIDYTNGNLANLNATPTYPNSDINIEPAWDLSSGAANVKVGVFDSGINFLHTDYGNGTFTGSKIKGGWDYYSNNPLGTTTTNDLYGHGSATSGIIGAIRNNNFGMAGIAGGDNLIGNPGVSLYDMEIFKGTSSCGSPLSTPMSVIANAIVEGAVYNPFTSFGFGQHVQNHSWVGAPDHGIPYDAFITAFDNEVFMSAGSGNADSLFPPPCSLVAFPATYPDRMVTKVGANDVTGAKAKFSECGFYLDLIAPGVKELYVSLDCSTNTTTRYQQWGTGCTAPLNGTSLAAPHVAGVAGLMASYINNTTGTPNPLYPEDCERLMERYATDLTASPNNPGYDSQTGWGRLNAGQTLSGIKFPDYLVKHYSISVPASGATLVGFQEQTCLISSMFSLPTGVTYVNRYQINATASHVIPTGYSFIDGWELSAGSNIYGINSVPTVNCFATLGTSFLPDGHQIILNNVSSTSANFTGYIYELLDNSFNSVGWYPFKLSGTAQFAYSLYLQSNTIGIKENSLTDHSISVYPVPSSDLVYLHSNLKELDKVNVKVYSALGQLLIEQNDLALTENSSINVSHLSNGVYFFNISVGSSTIIKKVIVNH